MFATYALDWRPNDKIRISPQYQFQQFRRRTDGSMVGSRTIPRLKVEYQVSWPIFVRFVGEYDARQQDDLRDDSRTNLPIVVRDSATGAYARALGFERNAFRVDTLFSYQPTPGTVFFAGYGSSLTEPESLRTGSSSKSATCSGCKRPRGSWLASTDGSVSSAEWLSLRATEMAHGLRGTSACARARQSYRTAFPHSDAGAT